MKLHAPNPAQRFAVVIDDCDADDLDVEFFATREEAEKHVLDEYGDLPDTTEAGGEKYLDTERPNARIHIAEVLSRTTL